VDSWFAAVNGSTVDACFFLSLIRNPFQGWNLRFTVYKILKEKEKEKSEFYKLKNF